MDRQYVTVTLRLYVMHMLRIIRLRKLSTQPPLRNANVDRFSEFSRWS